MTQWIELQPMPTPRHDLQAVAVGSEIYAISGAGYSTVDVVEVYDVETGGWRSGPPISGRRGWFGAALLDGAIYAIGGKRIRTKAEKQDGDNSHFAIRDSVERLDLASGTWSAMPPLCRPRAGLLATVCRDRIYAIGGNTMDPADDNPYLDLVEVFDPALGRWERARPLPFGIQGPALATVDDRIYLSAGVGVVDGAKGTTNHTFVYDPDADSWEELQPLPTGRCDPGTVAAGRRIYTFGGHGNGGYHDVVEVYDIDADAWTAETPMPEKRAWMGGVSIDGRIFVMGGGLRLTDDPKIYKWFDELHEFVPG